MSEPDEEPDVERDRSGIQSVEVAGTVLRAIIMAGQPSPLAELARLARMHPAKVHRYLVSLTRIGLVEQDRETGRYGAGAMTVPLALERLRSIGVVSAAGPVLQDLRNQTGETALLAIWNERGPVVIRLEESARPVFLNVRVGSTIPVYNTAAGRVFAAYLDPIQLAHVRKPFSGWSAKTAAQIKAAGFCAVEGMLVPGVNAIAAPVFDAFANLVAVIGLLGRDNDLDLSAQGRHVEELRNAAARLSAQLGAPSAPHRDFDTAES